MRQKIQSLIESGYFNANEVARYTGIPTNTVYRIFNAEAKLDNITLKNAEKLADFWDKHKLRDYSYVHQLVKSEILDDSSDIYDIAATYFGTHDGDTLIQHLSELYCEAAKGVDDFDMTLRDYLLACIEQDSETFEE